MIRQSILQKEAEDRCPPPKYEIAVREEEKHRNQRTGEVSVRSAITMALEPRGSRQTNM